MKIKAIAIMVALMLALTGCAGYNPDIDETAIETDGYIFIKTDKKLVECHSAGTAGYGGVGNDVVNLPAGQRTFSFTGNSSEAEMEPVPAVTVDGQTLAVPGFVKFTLTNDCTDLYDFWTKIGVKYDADSGEGWNNFLNDYLGTPITSSVNDATGDKGWLSLYQDATLRTDLEKELNATLQSKINSALGSDKWITIQGVTLSKPIASDELVRGLEAAEKAKLENKAQEQRNATARTKYETLGDCKKEVSEDWCAIFFLADQGKIDLLPIPSGGNLNVSPRG